MHGWRDCHTVPLPADVDTYLQKLSAKKRYNLSRQVRLLAKEAGEVKPGAGRACAPGCRPWWTRCVA
jgi:hypothetical protein